MPYWYKSEKKNAGSFAYPHSLLYFCLKFQSVNLIIDQGNSVTKMAIFEAGRLQNVEFYPQWNKSVVMQFLETHPIDAAIFSTVTLPDEEAVELLRKQIPAFHYFDHSSRIPISIRYHTPETLGLDRIAAATGAALLCAGKPALIIDAGTCVTYDLITEEGCFFGGNIAPGIRMRLQAMHEHTGKLPSIEPDGDLPEMGFSTETALRAGAVLGIVYEIEGYIARLKEVYPDLFVFLTGGDALKLAAKIKSRIFVDENLVLTGLNRILEENVKI